MRRSWIVCLALMSTLVARENPFLPSSKETFTQSPATNVQEKRPIFEQRSTKLPSNARILKYVTFGYQSLDGSIEEKQVMIDETIDWHDPLVITKEGLLNVPAPVEEPLAMEKPVILSTPPVTQTEVKMEVKPVEKTAFSFKDFIRFEVRERELVIETQDENIRDFLVANPYKIVLDFEREAAFYTKMIPVNQGSFKEITMGNHNGYYRAAILLDGHYRYELQKTATGYIIVLR